MAGIADFLGLTSSGNSGDSGMTPESIELQRELAKAMLTRGLSDSPVKSNSQGLNKVLQSMLGTYDLRKLDEADTAGKKAADDLLMRSFMPGASGITPSVPTAAPDAAAPMPMPADPALSSSAPQTGPSGSLADRINMAESGNDANAQNPNSSAGGAGQFIDSTWLSTIKKHMPGIAKGRSDAQLLTLKSSAPLSKQMTAAYAKDNAAILKAAGAPTDDAALSLAHFAGPQGATAIFANPTAPVERLLSPEAIEANPFLRGKTGADVIAWAGKRVGGNQTAAATPDAPAGEGDPAPKAANPAQQAMLGKALALAKNPRTAALGNALLQKIVLEQASPKPPIIHSYDDVDPTTGVTVKRTIMSRDQGATWQPFNGAAGQPQTAATPQDAPAAAQSPAAPLAPAPGLPAAAPALPPFQVRTEAPEAMAAAPASALVQPARSAKQDLLTPEALSAMATQEQPQTVPTAGVIPTVAPAAAPVAPARTAPAAPPLPAGTKIGPAFDKSKLGEGNVQALSADGRPLVHLDNTPVIETKAESEARAKADVKSTATKIDDNYKLKDAIASIDESFKATNDLINHPGTQSIAGRAFGGEIGFRGTGVNLADITPGTTQADAYNMHKTLISKVVLGTMQQLKATSAQGATGFGALSEKELKVLENSSGNLILSSSYPQLIKNYKAFQEKLLDVRERMIERYKSRYGDGDAGVISKQELIDSAAEKAIGDAGEVVVRPRQIGGFDIPLTATNDLPKQKKSSGNALIDAMMGR